MRRVFYEYLGLGAVIETIYFLLLMALILYRLSTS